MGRPLDTRKAGHLHRERMLKTPKLPEPTDTPELAAAWNSLQLHWLRTVPGYRDEIKKRVAAAARKAEKKSNRQLLDDSDLLGREIDPCG